MLCRELLCRKYSGAAMIRGQERTTAMRTEGNKNPTTSDEITDDQLGDTSGGARPEAPKRMVDQQFGTAQPAPPVDATLQANRIRGKAINY
jgi:hypothetical protein